jgi:voltage-gated potassium channel
MQKYNIKDRIYKIIFESSTRAGLLFDVVLIVFILLSVLLVMVDSVPSIHKEWGQWLTASELFITLIFTVEYVLRLYSARRPLSYALSFFGIVDLLAILPGYISLIALPGFQFLTTIRILRVLRIFRVLKLVQFMWESNTLWGAIIRSRRKITVFLITVLAVVVIVGSLMYLIEGNESGFSSIPVSIYWAIVTMTTVGYGDIAPKTPIGQIIASLLMIIGYGIIAVPTGIVTSEMIRPLPPPASGVCPYCGRKLDYNKDSENRSVKT